MKRVRHHIRPSIALQEEQIADIIQTQPFPIALTKIVQYWDILQIKSFDQLAYETLAVWLMRHVPEAHDLPSVERLVFQAFAEQQGYTQFTPEQALMLGFLADDVFEIWRAYLSRNNPLAFTPNRNTNARAPGLLGRHYSPKTSTS